MSSRSGSSSRWAWSLSSRCWSTRARGASAEDASMSDQPQDPVLEVRGLSKRFGGVHALERVDFTLRAGEVVALAGDNGAGKSTFTKIISGVFPPSEGDIRYCGRGVTFDGPQAARAQGIETIYQDLALADNLDIGGNVFLGRELKTKFLF